MKCVHGLVPFLLLASGCASAARDLDAASDYLPFEIGRTWVYEITDERGAVFRLATELKGGDVRSMQGEERVRFMFVYGTPAGIDHDITKSIYALPSTGPCEYYFDGMTWSLWHKPAIPLFPPVVAVGNEIAWRGKVKYDDDELEATAQVRVDGIETLQTPSGALESVRTRTVYKSVPLVVTRWFARGIGLVKMEMQAAGTTTSARLLSHASPAPRSD